MCKGSTVHIETTKGDSLSVYTWKYESRNMQMYAQKCWWVVFVELTGPPGPAWNTTKSYQSSPPLVVYPSLFPGA